MSGQNQQPLMNQQYSPQVPPSFRNDDEIDLRELFKALWEGKLIIILTTAVFAVGAVIFALMSQEWWSSKAKIVKPQLQDIVSYQQQVKQFQPMFDTYQDDGTLLVSTELDDLINTETLFMNFVNEFNSSINKKKFLDATPSFQQFKTALGTFETAQEEREALQKLYAEWFGKISATATEKNSKESYQLSLQSMTKESSERLLRDYVELIKVTVHNDALDNLKAAIDAKRLELSQRTKVLERHAANKIKVESERAKYAVAIASAAGIDSPIQTNNDHEIFSIDMGSKALEAKYNALQSVKNLSVVEPRILTAQAKLDLLNNIKIDRDIEFQTFRFLEDIEQPISRDKPKRPLIAVLGTLLGGMLGVAIVLVRFAFRREEDAQ